jgi:hypothetical protein
MDLKNKDIESIANQIRLRNQRSRVLLQDAVWPHRP